MLTSVVLLHVSVLLCPAVPCPAHPQTTSEKALRKQLQQCFKTDMSEKKAFIKQHVGGRLAGLLCCVGVEPGAGAVFVPVCSSCSRLA